MRRWRACFGTAVRFALIEQGRNRLALLMVLLFVPLWTTLAFVVVARAPLRFHVRPVGRFVVMDGNVLTQIVGALQALALVVAFMMFVATARSTVFDRRLVQAGFPRSCLALAKYASLVLVAAAVAVYATAWMHLFWRPVQPVVFAAGMFIGALVYGGIGIVLAAVVRSELAGMFLAIMISSIDLLLQNPLINPQSDSALVRCLPAHGAVQTAVTAAGLRVMPWSCLLLGFAWALGMAVFGIAAFAVRTRARPPSRASMQGVEATATAP
ncbi:ABC transporter permease [Streptomyces cadmiisoli]|uniref:ABC transporter permease n=1 Tax=Streptomyces cadmiisoli TaxID=2184053 RepID=UPI003D706FD0